MIRSRTGSSFGDEESNRFWRGEERLTAAAWEPTAGWWNGPVVVAPVPEAAPANRASLRDSQSFSSLEI